MKRSIRIGAGSAWWGDRIEPARLNAEQGDLDYLCFENLVAQCEAAARWEFLFVAAPLRIPRGTGSPINPIAVF